jgi:hypothetical protein
MIIPYFIGSVYVLVALCLALLALPYFFRV